MIQLIEMSLSTITYNTSRMSWPLSHGPEAHSGQCSLLMADLLLSPNKIKFRV
jgi:hypothetical protein